MEKMGTKPLLRYMNTNKIINPLSGIISCWRHMCWYTWLMDWIESGGIVQSEFHLRWLTICSPHHRALESFCNWSFNFSILLGNCKIPDRKPNKIDRFDPWRSLSILLEKKHPFMIVRSFPSKNDPVLNCLKAVIEPSRQMYEPTDVHYLCGTQKDRILSDSRWKR